MTSKASKDLKSTVRRLRELNVQVTHDGRPYRAPVDYLRDKDVQRQIQSLAELGIGQQVKR